MEKSNSLNCRRPRQRNSHETNRNDVQFHEEFHIW